MHERAVTHNLDRYIERLQRAEDTTSLAKAKSLSELFQSNQFIRRTVTNQRCGGCEDYNAFMGGKVVILDEKAELTGLWILPNHVDIVELLKNRDTFTIITEKLQAIETSDIESEVIEQAVNDVASEGIQTIGGIFLLSNLIDKRIEVFFPRIVAQRFGLWRPVKIAAYLLDATIDIPDLTAIRENLVNSAGQDKYYPGRYPFDN